MNIEQLINAFKMNVSHPSLNWLDAIHNTNCCWFIFSSIAKNEMFFEYLGMSLHRMLTPDTATNSWSSGYGTCIDASIKMQHEIRLFQFSIHCCSYLSVYSWEMKGNNEKKKNGYKMGCALQSQAFGMLALFGELMWIRKECHQLISSFDSIVNIGENERHC